jgi:hypothetical protein
MKAFDIALKDLTRSFRSAFAVVFMFGVPLLVTGMFYFMFGNVAENGGFNLPRTKVIIANMDEGGPKFQINPKNIPGGRQADTMGELIVSILESDDMADLIEISYASNPQAARASVDSQQSQVAIIIPADFSEQFADVREGKAVIEFYKDPTLTIGPAIMRSILNRFLDSMGGVKIAINVFMDEADSSQYALVGPVVEGYVDTSLALSEDLEGELLDVRVTSASAATPSEEESQNALLSIISPIMGGMMVFYAFFTGTSTAQSILKEEEERTLPRLFTTPTPQAAILHPDRQAPLGIHDGLRASGRAPDRGALDLWNPLGCVFTGSSQRGRHHFQRLSFWNLCQFFSQRHKASRRRVRRCADRDRHGWHDRDLCRGFSVGRAPGRYRFTRGAAGLGHSWPHAVPEWRAGQRCAGHRPRNACMECGLFYHRCAAL